MSLLLDALNRASKEKQKAAGAAMPGAAPVEPLQWEPLPAAAASEPALKPQPPAPQVDAAPAVWELSLEPAPAPASESTPTPLASDLSIAETKTAPPASVAEKLAPPVVKSMPAVPPELQHRPAVITPDPVLAHATAAPTLPAAAVAAPVSPPSNGFAAPPQPLAPQKQVAQEILRASASLSTIDASRRRRVRILGGLALGVALMMGGVFSGLLGDPGQLLGFGASSTLGAPSAGAPLPGGAVVSGSVEEPVAEFAAQPASVPQPVLAESAPALPAAAPIQVAAIPTAKANTQQRDHSPPGTRLQPVVPPPKTNAMTAPKLASVDARPAEAQVALRPDSMPKNAIATSAQAPGPLQQGYAALLDGRFDAASQAYLQALRANPQERDALLGLAYVSQQKGQGADAQAYYREVLRQEPGNAIAIAGLQSLDGRSESTGLNTLDGGGAVDQQDSAAALAVSGSALVRDGRLGDAAQAFARAQTMEPSNPLHAYNHAVALDRMGQHRAALRLYESVLNLDAAAPAALRAYQVDVVRARAAQLRTALGIAPQDIP